MKLDKLKELLQKSEEEVKQLVLEAIDNDVSIFPDVENELKTTKEQLDFYKKEVKQRDKDINELKNNSDVKQLTEKLTKLEEDYKQRVEHHKQEIKTLKFDTVLERELLKEKPKNLKAVKLLLELDSSKYDEKENSILGLKEKLQALKESDGYLFESVEQKQENIKIEGLQPLQSNVAQERQVSNDKPYIDKGQNQWTYQDWDNYLRNSKENI